MFNFDLKEARIFQAVRWERYPAFRFAKPLKKLFLVLFIFSFSFFIYGFLTDALTLKTQKIFLGLSIIFLVLSLINWLKESFLNSKLKKPQLKVKINEAERSLEEHNLAEFLSLEAAKAVWKSENNLSKLFYYLLSDNPELNFIFNRALLSLKEIKKILKAHFTPQQNLAEVQRTILDSLKIAKEKGHQRIEPGDILTALAKHDLIFKKILIDSNLKVEDIENLTWWLEDLEEGIEESKSIRRDHG